MVESNWKTFSRKSLFNTYWSDRKIFRWQKILILDTFLCCSYKLPFLTSIFTSFAKKLLYLNAWILEQVSTDLFLARVSTIPKPKKPPDQPANLRPISVMNVWYCIVAKVFTHRLTPYLTLLYSSNQSGFCPGRNILTALTNIKLCTDKEVRNLFASPLSDLNFNKYRWQK